MSRERESLRPQLALDSRAKARRDLKTSHATRWSELKRVYVSLLVISQLIPTSCCAHRGRLRPLRVPSYISDFGGEVTLSPQSRANPTTFIWISPSCDGEQIHIRVGARRVGLVVTPGQSMFSPFCQLLRKYLFLPICVRIVWYGWIGIDDTYPPIPYFCHCGLILRGLRPSPLFTHFRVEGRITPRYLPSCLNQGMDR